MSITLMLLAVFIYLIFRKPIKVTVKQMNEVIPEIVAASSDAAANSVVSATYLHRKELDEQLQEEAGVGIDEVRTLYQAMATKKSPKTKS